MNKFIKTISIIAVLACFSFAEEDECDERFNQMFAKMKEMDEAGELPSCMKEYGLDKFECGGDEKKREEMMPKLKEHLKKHKDKLQEIIDCSKSVTEKVMETMDVSEECKDKIINMPGMMFNALVNEEK